MQNISLNVEIDGHIAAVLYEIGCTYRSLDHVDDAKAYLFQALSIYQNISLDEEADTNITKILIEIGCCFVDLTLYDNALIYLHTAFQVYKRLTLDKNKDINITTTLSYIGRCHINTKQNLVSYEDTLNSFNYALKIRKHSCTIL